MNILVTGAAGFIGGHLAKTLSKFHTVYGGTHDRFPADERIAWTPISLDIEHYPRVLEVVASLEIDRIYHCASKSIVRNCRIDPLGCLQTNVMGTANLLEAARQSDRVGGVMCMESDKAYGDGAIPYIETQQLQPKGIYEASKSCVSHLVGSYYANYGTPVFGVRSANVYGPNDPNQSRLIPNTINRLRQGLKPQVVEGALEFLREFIYIDDFIIYVTGLMQEKPWGQSINVGTGRAQTVEHVVKTICALLDKPDEIEMWGRPKTLIEIKEQRLDVSLLRELIPNIPPSTLIQGLRETINAS